jgi:hypothetical protein
MVKLCVDDFDQVTTLEWLLTTNNIDYTIELSGVQYGIRPPFLVVDGVPLDFNRSMKWIKGHTK